MISWLKFNGMVLVCIFLVIILIIVIIAVGGNISLFSKEFATVVTDYMGTPLSQVRLGEAIFWGIFVGIIMKK